ncbi:MAG: mitochondrial fission ELM1 family protein [Alphaproteobacteria bacterium]
MKTWILTNRMIGFESQTLGVAEALGVVPERKSVTPPAPWRWFAPWGPAAPNDEIAPPWPELLIASGRQTVPYARKIRRLANGNTFVAILQDPRISPAQFDFVWAPLHDRLTGRNVFSTLLSPHRVTPERLAEEGRRWSDSVSHLPRPRVAVLLGGTNAVYEMDEAEAHRIGDMLAEATGRKNAGLMITPSRRTGEKQTQIIRECTKDVPSVIWDGVGENPYFGYLGNADAVIVTCDSVNMVSEAIATGKPVQVIEIKGGSARFRRFLDEVYRQGLARPFRACLESWPTRPLNATSEIAQAIAGAISAWRSRKAEQFNHTGPA